MLIKSNTFASFERTDELLSNPFIGFVEFNHFGNGKLFSDEASGPEKESYPIAASVPQIDRAQNYHPDSTVVYIRILWKNFEKAKDVYDYAFIESILAEVKRHGQSLMLRLMPHTTKRNEDIPEYLKEEIEYPARPDNQRVKESPTDPKFIDRFCKAVYALGERFDGRDELYAVDISLTGAWGEGHMYETYPESDVKKLMDTYLAAFQKTPLLGQICSPELNLYANSVRPIGYRADGFGDGFHMLKYFPEPIYLMRDFWKKSPISFEAYWYISEWDRQGWDIDYMIEQSLKWHVSTFNNKSSTIPLKWKSKVEAWLKKMGYRFSLRNIRYPSEASAGDTLQISTWIENTGVAPIYKRIPLKFMFKNSERAVTVETDADIREWMPGDSIERLSVKLPSEVTEGEYDIFVGITDGNGLDVKFATAAEKDGAFLKVGRITIKA